MLYLVATPIGNLGDITLRALEILREADLVVSEDTRKTGLLLKHFDIRKPQLSFYEQNEKRQIPKILQYLQTGEKVALVTNAGSPAVSDPGYSLVRAAIEAGIKITAIPGATALVPALTLSGLPVHSFIFRGFSPRKQTARRKFLAVDAVSPHTLIFYESPYRLKSFLEDALYVFGDRMAAVANDLTKFYERVDRNRLSELISRFEGETLKGEYCVVIAGSETQKNLNKGSD